ncbi:MAG: hypothetical protein LBT90_01865 [Holosporaceae bacterium]|jgi:hypothetical protein|nr:hypothetical protein [Holosporaceae bacterium]
MKRFFVTKFIKITLLLTCCFIFCLNVSASSKSKLDQVSIFNSYANGSWQSKQINIDGQFLTIEQHLVMAYSGPEKDKKRIIEEVKKYYKERHFEENVKENLL